MSSDTSPSDTHINARLSDDGAARFQELLESSGLKGFIGSGEGPEDLSVRYKDYLSESLESKISSSVQPV